MIYIYAYSGTSEVLGRPIFFIVLEVFFTGGYKSIEEYANGTLEKFHYERFFTIGEIIIGSFTVILYISFIIPIIVSLFLPPSTD